MLVGPGTDGGSINSKLNIRNPISKNTHKYPYVGKTGHGYEIVNLINEALFSAEIYP
jgi:hypothetical protein